MERISTGLANALLITGSLKAALDGSILDIFSGVPPAHADDMDAGNLVCRLTESADGATPLTFDGTITIPGVLSKTPGEVWAGNNLGNYTATHWRLQKAGDSNASSTTAIRVQGTLGVAGTDILVGDVNFINGELFTLVHFYQAFKVG
jgi:hypothetical protein